LPTAKHVPVSTVISRHQYLTLLTTYLVKNAVASCKDRTAWRQLISSTSSSSWWRTRKKEEEEEDYLLLLLFKLFLKTLIDW